MKVGLFFGSFNPIHIGHMVIGNVMVETTDLDEVWYVVSPQNPFKKNKNLLHEFDRLQLVESALEDNDRLKACDIEFGLPRPSYTIDTLTHLKEKHPTKDFVLIIGSDNLESFKRWKNYEQILEYFSLYVYLRPDSEKVPLIEHEAVEVVEAPLLNISATFIRKCIRENQSIRYMVPDPVEDLIRIRKYYI